MGTLRQLEKFLHHTVEPFSAIEKGERFAEYMSNAYLISIAFDDKGNITTLLLSGVTPTYKRHLWCDELKSMEELKKRIR